LKELKYFMTNNDEHRRKVRRNETAASLCKIKADDYMSDIELLAPPNSNGGVVFGVYGTDDWVTCTHVRAAIDDGQSTLVMGGYLDHSS
jgi:hypothetical protein